MTTFIEEVLTDLQKKEADFSQLTFILPSKRAGNFLKHSLAKLSKKTIYAPEIFSIEEFVESISLLKSVSNTELLFELYEVYSNINQKSQLESFDAFSKWAQTIIQDFNEIDRYLIPEDKLFNYLKAIKQLNHWSLEKEKTELVKNYLSFWKKLPQYYHELKNTLTNKGIAYQGLVYKEAVDKLELYIQHNSQKQYVFMGFNALNNAEQTIIQELLQQGLATIYWDLDSTFFASKFHDAGLFIRSHQQWYYFKNHPFNWLSDYYNSEKNIQIIGIPKKVGQAKYIGELLLQIKNSEEAINSTALVLGDESLLTPVLNSIPPEIGPVNITMGMPLNLVPLASLFETLFNFHKTPQRTNLYYKDVIAIISNPFVRPILDHDAVENTDNVIAHISANNMTYIDLTRLEAFFPTNSNLLILLLGDWNNNSKLAIQNCLKAIQHIKPYLDQDKNNNLLSLEYLFKFNQVFNQLSNLLEHYDFVKDIKTLYGLYKEILSAETLDFQGEQLQGLQILGVLESRVIDFETVIITSVNEGILPSGKSNNSFIPFDVKLEYGLPTYKEKDAVYTYHFYHLLQRAKNIYILYNTEIDALQGGEKSRFITQLEVEGTHNIKHFTVSPKVTSTKNEFMVIPKTNNLNALLKKVASSGFSPSALTTYIRNPIDFYKQKVLNINTFEDVEETVAANTLGTILHDALEALYLPVLNTFLTKEHIENMHSKIEDVVAHHFKKEYKEGDITKGKNLIIFEIAKRYIANFLNKELEAVNKGKQIKIIALEKKMRVQLNIPELDFPVYLKGTVDRIDECDGVLRIIDYKSGKVEQGKVEITNWEDLNTDYDKYSKTFQILTYAYMMHVTNPFQHPIEAGIISFKNLKSGLLKFGKKESPKSRTKETLITQDTFNSFEIELKKLILEICNPDMDIVEKKLN